MKTKLTSTALILASTLFLSGCVYQRADNFDLHRSVKFCKEMENVANIIIFVDGDEKVTCMDGSSAFLHEVKND